MFTPLPLDPAGLLAWLAIGMIAGFLAGYFVRGHGFGLVGDIVVGMVGAVVGGLLYSLLLSGSSTGWVGSIAVAFVSAVVLLAVVLSAMVRVGPRRRFGL